MIQPGRRDGMKNVLLVAYQFPPRGGTPVQRPAKFAKYLPAFGYRPLVLTRTYDRELTDTDATLMKDVEGIDVFHCRGWERLVVDLPRKLKLNPLVSFWLCPDKGVLAWVPSAVRAARRIAAEHPLSAIWTTVDPFSNVLLGARLKKIFGVPWVVDYRDPWTDESRAVWPTKLHYRWAERQERRALAYADAIVVVTPGMKELLVRRYPQWAAKIHVIYNGFDRDDLSPIARPAPGPRLEIGHAGALFPCSAHYGGHGQLAKPLEWWIKHVAFRLGETDYSTHSPYYLLQAARALLDEHPELSDKLRISFAGHFNEPNRRLVEQLKLESVVELKGFLPHTQCIAHLESCDALFLPLHSPGGGRRCEIIPAKVFEYLALGKPILAAVPDGDLRDLVQRSGAGWCVAPKDVQAIKRLLQEMIEKKMAHTLHVDRDEAAIAQFDRKELTRQLASLLDKLSPVASDPAVRPRVIVAQLGSRQGYVVPAVLERAGRLERLYTDICASVWPWRLLDALLPRALCPAPLRRLLGRRAEGVSPQRIRCFSRFGFYYAWAMRRARSGAQLARMYCRTNEQFGKLVVASGLAGADAVYGYNGASLEIFREAKKHGMQTFLEQTLAPEALCQRLLAEEWQRWPGWEAAPPTPEDWGPLARREEEEWSLADKILCGSEFVRDGVQACGGLLDRCAIVPYSAAARFFSPPLPRRNRDALHVLCVGGVSLRKGIPYLMEAAQKLASRRLVVRVVGKVLVADAAAAQLRQFVELLGPVPRAEVSQQYRWADVFVLPSICEGSAVVCYEALAAGLPVITTPNAGSVVRDGQEGFIVPIRDAEAIAARLDRLASDRPLLEELSANAARRAKEFTWERYGQLLLAALRT